MNFAKVELVAQVIPEERKWAMGILACAEASALSDLWQGWAEKPAFDWLRQPESGLVMVRGRMGGDGAAFNLGEMTVTRCTLRLEDGTLGQACVQGRSMQKATQSALVDALYQRPADRDAVRRQILEPLAKAREAAKAKGVRETQATKVEFFTLVRGDNE